MSTVTLDPEHARRSIEASRQCRELVGALTQGKNRWGEIEALVRTLEAHLQSSSEERPVALWKLALACLRALDSEHRLRTAARSSSGGVTEESARLAVLLRELEECLAEVGTESSRGHSDGTYSLDSVQFDAKAALDLLSVLPLPTLYYTEKEDVWEGRRARSAPVPEERRPPLLKVIAFIDEAPLVCPQVLRPGLLYSLRLRIRGSFWATGTDSLRLDLISTCPAGSYTVSQFSIPRPKTDGEFEAEADGNITFHAAQSPGSMNLAFTVRCRFHPDEGASSDAVVVGHHRLQFRVGDLSRLAIASGYRRMDARVLELLQGLERSTPAVSSELPELLRVLEALASFLGVYSQRGVFKESDKVQEKEFQQHVVDFMRMKLGEEVQEHGNQAGGITDIRYRGVIVELKVEKDTGDRAAICKKYTAQPTQYEGSEARQLSVLLVLDLTEKDLPPGDIRNDILLADVPTHGGADSSKPHPSKAFVFVLNGNIRSPSSYS
jgi:hypothetical protein